MQLYWSPYSPFVRKALVSIHELGLADKVEIIPMKVRMDELNQDMLALNPLGKIPTLLRDDGTVIFDSFAIIDYLDEQAGHILIPALGEARREVLRHHATANGLMDLLVLWRNERDKPVDQHSAGWITGFNEKTARTLDLFEREAKALHDIPINLGHISIAVVLAYLDFRFDALQWRKGRTHLAEWHAQFLKRPSMIATAIDA